MSLKSENIKSIGLGLVVIVLIGGIFAAGEMKGFHPRYVSKEDCYKCHTLTVEEAAAVINSPTPAFEVRSVDKAPMNGLWEVVYQVQGKRGIAYIDFSKQHIIIGSLVDANTKQDVTRQKLNDLGRIEPTSVPLDKALVMGDKDAKYKVIVFDDPD